MRDGVRPLHREETHGRRRTFEEMVKEVTYSIVPINNTNIGFYLALVGFCPLLTKDKQR